VQQVDYIIASGGPPARYDFTAKTTRQKHFAHGNNAVAYFFCRGHFQVEPKHLIHSSIL
jgi:hypothetical protein